MGRVLIAILSAGLMAVQSACAADLVAISTTGARADIDALSGRPVIEVHLSPSGQQAFAAFTGEHVGKQVDLLVENEVVLSPIIRDPIDVPMLQISGIATLGEAEALARSLSGKTGRLFVRLAGERLGGASQGGATSL